MGVAALEADEHFEVWPENWLTLEVFIACQTQWRYLSGMSVEKTGLDYTAVTALMNAWGVEDTREVFDGVRLVEATVLSVWAGVEEESAR